MGVRGFGGNDPRLWTILCAKPLERLGPEWVVAQVATRKGGC